MASAVEVQVLLPAPFSQSIYPTIVVINRPHSFFLKRWGNIFKKSVHYRLVYLPNSKASLVYFSNSSTLVRHQLTNMKKGIMKFLLYILLLQYAYPTLLNAEIDIRNDNDLNHVIDCIEEYEKYTMSRAAITMKQAYLTAKLADVHKRMSRKLILWAITPAISTNSDVYNEIPFATHEGILSFFNLRDEAEKYDPEKSISHYGKYLANNARSSVYHAVAVILKETSDKSKEIRKNIKQAGIVSLKTGDFKNAILYTQRFLTLTSEKNHEVNELAKPLNEIYNLISNCKSYVNY